MNNDPSEITSLVEDMTRTLRNSNIEYDELDIRNEIAEYMERFNIPLPEIKRTILKNMMGSKYGGPVSTVERSLADLKEEERGVDIVARVVTVNPKTITVNGKSKQIFYGLLSDGTITVPYTAWVDVDLRVDSVVKLHNTSIKLWRERPQVNINSSSFMEPSDADIPEYHWNTPEQREIGSLRANLSSISVVGRVLDVEERTIEVKGEEKQIHDGILADGTGKVRFTCWNGFDHTIGDVLRIEGCYTREFGGVVQLNFDQRSRLELLPDDELPSMDELHRDTPVKLMNMVERRGAIGVVVKAVLVEIRQGSGLVQRCPVCNRVLKRDSCMLHGRQDGIPDLRLKAVMDDGTATASLIVGRPGSEALLQLSMEDCIALAKEKVDMDYPGRLMAEGLTGRSFEIHGDIRSDEYGLKMITNEVDPYRVEPVGRAKMLLDRSEVGS